jgi:CBS domain-containing protein
MLASQLINSQIIALRPSDTAEVALELMAAGGVQHLPLVENASYKGLLKYTVLSALDDPDTELGRLAPELSSLAVYEGQELFEFMHLFKAYDTDILPVLNAEDAFQGALVLKDVFFASQPPSGAVQGGVIKLSMGHLDYSLAEISRLIEAEQVRIISSQLELDPENPMRVHVTLRLNTDVLHRVVATLERFNYQVIYKPISEESYQLEAERLDSLLKFLSI